MERKYKYLTAASGLVLSLATLTTACGGENSSSKNTDPTPSASNCFDSGLRTVEARQPETKSITEKRLNETLEFMKCSAIEPLMLFADQLKQLQMDGYLVLDNFSRPDGVAAGEIASVTFYGGFPTLNDSSFRMTVDLNENGMSYADYSIFLYKEALVMAALNEQIKNAPNMGTKVASSEDRTAIECLAWINTIKNVGIPLKGKVEVEKIKKSIEAYEHQNQEDIIDCIDSADLN